ncbi:MAG: sigma-70 family RNA polymerase sigma factor [Myxococcales bacterium]|nr:sigma-70 family RNA polymerase sigma factor [Myxococcales bacterium]
MPRSAKEIAHERRLFEAEARPLLDNLYATALRLTRSQADAEDLVQDTLVRAYRFYDRFEAGTNFKAWLLRIQMNTFVNRYRRNIRERRVFDGPMATPVGEGVISRASMRGLTDPVGDAQRKLIGREIARAFDELSEDARAMVLLADVQELSYKEIAEIVACPIGTVMSRLHRARKQLQLSLQAQAVQLGIIDEDDEGEPMEPVSLEAFRTRKAVKS